MISTNHITGNALHTILYITEMENSVDPDQMASEAS